MILNGDDPEIYNLGKNIQADISYFGLADRYLTIKEIPHDVDSVYCPKCGAKLSYSGIAYSHVGNFSCSICDFKRENVETFARVQLSYPLLGIYNMYNTHAVALGAMKAFGLSQQAIADSLKDFKPAFGRQEYIEYKGRKIFMLLSKNPTGMNQSIRVVAEHFKEEKPTILVILNDRFQDGTDVSWIWDAEFEELFPIAKKLFVSGDRAHDMAIRFKYGFDEEKKVITHDELMSFAYVELIEEAGKAIEKAVEHTPEGETLVILPTYTAMLDARKILAGRKIL
jgi:UDP-N-acetylmuramyl tripeptide synthase